MGFVVLLIVFALVGFFVGVAKAADSAGSGQGQEAHCLIGAGVTLSLMQI